jgi:hypothetical protein
MRDHAAVLEDEMDKRTAMEASENTGRPPLGSGGTGLHRVDPDRVAQTLGSDTHVAGYARLELMLNAVLPRLVGEPGGRGEKPA